MRFKVTNPLYFMVEIINFAKKISLIIFFLFSQNVHAKIKIFAAENPPLIMQDKQNKITGIGGDIFVNSLNLLNDEYEIVWLPWLRAFEECKKNKNSLLIPIGGNKENKKIFNLFGELYEDSVHFFTISPQREIKTFAEINKLTSLGMISGAPFADIVENYGLKDKLEISYNGELLITKLKNNRIDSIIITKLLGTFKLLNAKVDFNNIQKGISIGTMKWFIAANKDFPKGQLNKLKNKLEKFRKTEKYQQILTKYFSVTKKKD
ncbi:transporter substrate-binding domain-containing protein [Pigmentibacter sp. JX0631]|uniref:substrate-binding periplasmic protein n=1 Tax=Pigmentibacter sp. JX0631 TaxID=2976982 RepID=UPI00246933B1|nr:transporter substrate-binding domain-containing protein [Pigmentibacter sp. JX0631]WGL59423.1 transporter substrate-binding domain-containing protein [Pigmentibacter sp. JX0631]